VFERFSENARRAIVIAQEEARLFGHNWIGCDHLVIALAREREALAAEVLEACGVTVDRLREIVLERHGDGGMSPTGHIPFEHQAKSAIEGSFRQAQRLGDPHVGTAHLLLSLVRQTESAAADLLTKAGCNVEELEPRVRALVGHRERLRKGRPLMRPIATSAAIAVPRRARALAGHEATSSSHFLLALFDDPSSVASKVLASFGLERDAVADRIREIDIAGTTDELRPPPLDE
jgi:ATP-dependent Clp protease ATP-binding subunit ClpC